MSTAEKLAQSYDQIPFPSQSLPETHPDRLASIATLFGMNPRPIAECRVLEIGCGTGGNLVPMADRHPNSTFVGIDLSEQQIKAGRRVAAAAELTNVRLEQRDLMDVDASLGSFDYIIAHGVFSWVPRAVQARILTLCRTHLAPQGVAYISYNTYPGWHLKRINRELMNGAAPVSAPPQQRIAQARRVMEFFARHLPAVDAPHNRVVKQFVDVALTHDDSYLLHEYMEYENYPLYFHDFIEQAAANGLKDATPTGTLPPSFAPQVQQALRNLATDATSWEQHLDVLRNRTFRQTLLCHQEVPLSRETRPEWFARLFVLSPAQPAPAPVEISLPTEFILPGGGRMTSRSPALTAALLYLGGIWPASASLADIFDQVAASMRGRAVGPLAFGESERLALVQDLMQCAQNRAADLRSGRDQFTTRVTEQPCVSALARLQARTSRQVTNRRHEGVTLDDFGQRLFPLLDGKHDRRALVQSFVDAVDRREISLELHGRTAPDGNSIRGALEQAVEESLHKIAAGCLLVA